VIISSEHTAQFASLDSIRLRCQGSAAAETFCWALSAGTTWRIGCNKGSPPPPEIDLVFDKTVSSEHAHVWFAHDRWWIEDTRSTNDTFVNEEPIRGRGPVELAIDCLIKVGATVLLVEPSHRHKLTFNGALVEVDIFPTLNYSLVHCGQPFLLRVVVKNTTENETRESSLNVVLPHFGSSDVKEIPPLRPEEVFVVDSLEITFDRNALESNPEATTVDCTVQFNDERKTVPIQVLAANEWSTHVQHRRTLAAFVLPNHALVQGAQASAAVAASVLRQGATVSLHELVANGQSETVVHAFYETLRSRNIEYRHEQPSFRPDSQKIRLPHQVLIDEHRQLGMGTCIDLVLLLASCLEAAEAQPLILILQKSGHEQHALLG
jgi:hypothetical protein